MTAAAIIERIRVNGGEINLVADNLHLRLPASLINELADAVRSEKDAIKRALRRDTGDPWDADDWRAFFDERAGIAEHDGGLSRAEAEAIALECCVVDWLNRHPVNSDSDNCAWCGRPDVECHAIVPFGNERRGHAWLHPECWQAWHQRRRADAFTALRNLGISERSSPEDKGQRSAL